MDEVGLDDATSRTNSYEVYLGIEPRFRDSKSLVLTTRLIGHTSYPHRPRVNF